MILPKCLSIGGKSIATALVAASPILHKLTPTCLGPCQASASSSLAAIGAAAVSTSSSSTSASLLSQLSPSVMNALLLLSGGAAKQPVMDINRFKLRLDGLHTYAVITTLMMNASMRLFSATPKRFVAGEDARNIFKILFSIMVTVSILMGSYTTIVFSLLELYAKRALGRNHQDGQVLQFFAQTQPVRELAYDTWVVSLVAFQASFVLSLFLNHDPGWDWKIATAATLAALLCWWKWSTVMALAAILLDLGSDM